MGITVNATIGSGEGQGGTSLTFSHTLNAASNRIVVVGAGLDDAGDAFDIDSVTYNGINLTFKVSIDTGTGAGSEIWYLLEADLPADGAHDIVISYPATITRKSGISVVLEGAKQEAPEASGTDTATTTTEVSASITTLSDNAMIVALASAATGGDWTPGSGETEQLEVDSGTSHTSALNTKILVSAGATTMAPTYSASSKKALTAAAFAPFVAAAGGLTPRSYPRGVSRGLMRGVA